jgi:hypothetical protein
MHMDGSWRIMLCFFCYFAMQGLDMWHRHKHLRACFGNIFIFDHFFLQLWLYLFVSAWNAAPLFAAFVGAGFLVRPDRSIHDGQARQFLCGMLCAGSWHEKLLSDGLAFDWISGPPTPYCEPNNKAAIDNLPQLSDSCHVAGRWFY